MKTLRVFCTDPDATDSSSDEEDENFPENPTKSKRFLREITIAADDLPPEKPTSPPLETPEKVVEKYPGVRKRISGKYTAEIRDPFKKVKIWLGSFNTAKDAYDVYCKKKLEFEALKSEKNGGVEVPEGVKKVNSGKYGVLIDDPKSNTKVWLGSYDSVDEAVRVYREKECEFEEGGVVRKERLLSDLYDGKIDNVVGSCVECSDGKWEGRVWDPVVKSLVSVGVFDTRTQAQFVVRNKEGLFRRRFEVERDECGGGGMADGGSMNGFGYESSDVIIALGAPKLSKEEIAELRKNRGLKLGKVRDGELSRDSRVPGCEFGNVRRETVSGRESGRLCGKVETAKEKTRNFNFVERNTRDKFGPELPPGVRVTKAGRFGAWVTHPISGNDYCLRSYDTIEEALKGIRNKMAQFEKEFNSKKRARPNGDVFGTPKKAVSEATYGSPTSVLDVRHEEHENSGTNVKIEFEYCPSHDSLDTVFKDKRVINEDVSVYQNNGIDNTSSENQLVFPITFDELVKSGIINEYGQLLGEYCKCDELMWLSNHNDVN